jgi:hypothetical protein
MSFVWVCVLDGYFATIESYVNTYSDMLEIYTVKKTQGRYIVKKHTVHAHEHKLRIIYTVTSALLSLSAGKE